MGIPKFFRYISERYPLTSQLIQENKIPEFDNLYVDFNGIIHNCSHPNDDDPHYRISEEQIFTSIFAYVDHLFSKIKPKKLFFMAVDGVAPRAKMNQQRSRRFKTAREAQENKEKALRKGEVLPEGKAFDSNCITPGTPFMTRLSAQLRYFVNKKISEDANWRSVQVVLSGHEVPGEGEHKIMEYIRLSKAQPDYNPNVRHCLYGLDADLVMLGLLSHDPHFCLLREEVKFGPAKKKGNQSLESQTFFLLHLCLLREYLDLEFRSLQYPTPTPSSGKGKGNTRRGGQHKSSKSQPAVNPNGQSQDGTMGGGGLPFEYNLERIIDDFILLAVFVGNDFLPNLPDLHIHENGLEKLFDVYKRVLPKAGGYLNEAGVINTQRLQLILDEMAIKERESWEKENADVSWFKGKQRSTNEAIELARRRGDATMTSQQHGIFERVKIFILTNRKPKPANPSSSSTAPSLAIVNDFAAKDKTFISKLAEELHLVLTWDEYNEDDRNVVTFRFPETEGGTEEVVDVNGNGTNGAAEDDEGEWEDVDDDEEGRVAVDRVLKKYEKFAVLPEDREGDFDKRHDLMIQEKMDEWKRTYYREKLEFSYDDPKPMHDLAYKYVEGLQWVMHYYYSGVASWGWFYSYHYAPRISDLKGVDKFQFNFNLGKPFRPFEQLMGVLPEASKDHIPLAYQGLMYEPDSPLIQFYPKEFEQDLNGKKQDWEAVVKIPFMEEEKLLKAMADREHRLTSEEQSRNTIGTSTSFVYNPDEETVYPSSLPGFFPPIYHCRCIEESFDLPTLDGLHLIPGLCDGVHLGAAALAGFPSLQTLPHTAVLGYHGVSVFQQESKNQSMVVQIQNTYDGISASTIAERVIGERTFINWPFLQEGQVVAVSDSHFRYERAPFGNGKKVVGNPHNSGYGMNNWGRKAEMIESRYSKRCGVITGPVEVLLHVRPLKGLKRLDTGAMVKDYEGEDKETEQAVQMALSEVIAEDARYLETGAPSLTEEFPKGSKVFFLGEHAYGVAAQVDEVEDTSLSVILAFFPSERAESEKFTQVVTSRSATEYYPAYHVADMLAISGLALAKITSSFMVAASDGSKSNLGLSLKFEAKGMKVLDYSRKSGKSWEFSDDAVALLREYKQAFPDLFRGLESRNSDIAQAKDMFQSVPNPDTRVKDVRLWLQSKGVRDFEPVSLFCDALKKETVAEIEKLADGFNATKLASGIKKAIVKAIPRQAVLKPSHTQYRLQDQVFGLGDRVIMVQDSGAVPLSIKGVVVGLNANSMDVVWDNTFLSGSTLQGRCSQYRGSTVDFNTCLNLTNPQFIMSTKPGKAQPPRPPPPARPQYGPMPVVRPRPGQAPAGGFRPAGAQMHIMQNPNRGPPPRSGPNVPPAAHGAVRLVGGRWQQPNGAPNAAAALPADPAIISASTPSPPEFQPPRPMHRGRGRGEGRGSGGGYAQGHQRGGSGPQSSGHTNGDVPSTGGHRGGGPQSSAHANGDAPSTGESHRGYRGGRPPFAPRGLGSGRGSGAPRGFNSRGRGTPHVER